MKKRITGGVLVPACSPCGTDDGFLEQPFLDGLSAALKAGMDGAYLCGGTGDGMNMRLDERKKAMELGIQLCRELDKCVLVQVGAPTMRDALELAEYAAKLGADGISTVPLSGFSHAQQLYYYRELIRAAGGLDAILYYMPGPGATFSLDEVLETLAIPGVTGIKCSTTDFFFTQQLMLEKPKGTVLFSGKDEYLAPAVIHGADGGIGMWATVFPKTYSGIYSYAKAGRYEEAFHLQKELNALCCAVMRQGLIGSFACILKYLGMHERVFRRPEPQYTPAAYDAFIPQYAELIDRLRAGE